MNDKSKPQKSNNRIEWIESLRGIACLIVLFAHIIASDSEIGIYASGCGKIGVWLFMIFSGMLLITTYFRGEFKVSDMWQFYKKKALRIYPTYVIAIFLAYICGIIENLESVVRHIFLLESWGHFWYMPVIIKFYIVAPLFLLLLKILKGNRVIFAFVISIIAVILAIVYPYYTYAVNSNELKWYMPVFIMGMLLAIIIELRKRSKYYDVLALLSVAMILIETPVLREVIWKIQPNDYLQNKYDVGVKSPPIAP